MNQSNIWLRILNSRGRGQRAWCWWRWRSREAREGRENTRGGARRDTSGQWETGGESKATGEASECWEAAECASTTREAGATRKAGTTGKASAAREAGTKAASSTRETSAAGKASTTREACTARKPSAARQSSAAWKPSATRDTGSHREAARDAWDRGCRWETSASHLALVEICSKLVAKFTVNSGSGGGLTDGASSDQRRSEERKYGKELHDFETAMSDLVRARNRRAGEESVIEADQRLKRQAARVYIHIDTSAYEIYCPKRERYPKVTVFHFAGPVRCGRQSGKR